MEIDIVRPRISGALVLLASFLFIAAIASIISATMLLNPVLFKNSGFLGVYEVYGQSLTRRKD